MLDGISLIPNTGIQTQKIPPIISVNDKRVSSAAGIVLDPIEYNIKPIQTKVPCNAKRLSFLLEEKKFKSLLKMTINENKKVKMPAKATVVNFGVSFLHLNDTEKTENPVADIIPYINPSAVPNEEDPNPIIAIPIDATIIDIQTFKEIFSFKNKNPSNAVMNGIAAKHNNVIAAVVFVIDQIKVIIAVPSPMPPIVPDIPIFK